ncbi:MULTISPECIES: YggL family protein [unclassified Gilliamella]|uniref:YggL family protein n=1 Tax=unclassified Gilliamella TaxID=2685620 RepID=UPI00226A8E49|nr:MULTISPECIES: YggL family protein [unclassified Gilliamella]MCX8642419.1 YggL family protein [Gilliamella sp. B3835]MCX8706269.1 YggL family protein [Gilliamella sp. B3783]MCX8709591.1 YggL family protein [Gilliamella sp. B3780]MCX8714320.1 YggL family protein [Gilliamella sp. B3781]MCX8717001.1 YggL family protein [Gilliamella sp. B3784]
MAKVNRSRRLRKKLHIEEFKELGFTVSWSFDEGTSEETIDSVVDQFIIEAIQANGLAYEGSGYLSWQGIICTQKLGNCTDENRDVVTKWLENHGLKNVKTSELIDIWWDELDF